VAYELPDVFQNNPYRGAVNGSLWTMPYELRMYAILASTWLLLQMAKKTQRINLPKIIISGTALSGLFLISSKTGAIESTGPFLHLFFMFFFGASFYVLQKKIALSRPIFWAALIALLLSTLNKSAFNIAYIATLPYILFYIAYVPSGRIRKFNNFGDYSYGLYIYAFPIQQAIAALIPGASIQAMIIISSGITLIFSILSWHIIEKRALGLKARYVQKTQNFLSLGLKSR
jgi:peptidoglycan/LPS O-acetylase OafA/YrhL